MGRVDSPECHRCHATPRNFFHMIWLCPGVGKFWKAILGFLEDKLALPNKYSPARCLLGDFGEEEISNSKKILLWKVFLYAKKAKKPWHLNGRIPPPPCHSGWIWLIKFYHCSNLLMHPGDIPKNVKKFGQGGSLWYLVILMYKDVLWCDISLIGDGCNVDLWEEG